MRAVRATHPVMDFAKAISQDERVHSNCLPDKERIPEEWNEEVRLLDGITVHLQLISLFKECMYSDCIAVRLTRGCNGRSHSFTRRTHSDTTNVIRICGDSNLGETQDCLNPLLIEGSSLGRRLR